MPSTPNVPKTNSSLLTVEETAEILGLSRYLTYQATSTGEIPSVRIGRRVFVPKIALDDFLRNTGAANSGDVQKRR